MVSMITDKLDNDNMMIYDYKFIYLSFDHTDDWVMSKTIARSVEDVADTWVMTMMIFMMMITVTTKMNTMTMATTMTVTVTKIMRLQL